MDILYRVHNEIEWNYLMEFLEKQGTRWWNCGNTSSELNSIKYDKFIKGVAVFSNNNTAVWKNHVNEKRYWNYTQIFVKEMMQKCQSSELVEED